MSFLQWAGGKVKSLPQISPFIPKEISNYYEPFLGGGSVLLHVLQKADAGDVCVRGKLVAGDINQPLVQCFQAIKDNGDAVVEALERLCGAYEACPPASACKKHYCVCCCQECMYHAIRTCFNIYKSAPIVPEVELAAHFLFLNATCYRGLYRESKAGAFNTCYWSSRPLFPKSDRILEASRLFRKFDVHFVACSFQTFWDVYLSKGLTDHDFCYVDPPFVKEKGKVVDKKTHKEESFSVTDADWVREWVLKHCNHTSKGNVMYNTYGSVAESFTWPHVHLFSAHRSMMYKGSTQMTECVITSYIPPILKNEEEVCISV